MVSDAIYYLVYGDLLVLEHPNAFNSINKYMTSEINFKNVYKFHRNFVRPAIIES